MVEVQMMRRMVVRGLAIAPVVIGALWLWRGSRYGISGGAGLAMTLLNLWLSARILGGVAEKTPRLLLPAGIATMALGLMVLTGVALVLRATDAVHFPVTGLVLIGSHLGLVLWEASGSYKKIPPPASVASGLRS
ncbi:MAG TPA: hypothetical protein VNC78_09470 [Actinomycetota bacterium]|nr:hypothetical protein [Actinomycetota bacterium]